MAGSSTATQAPAVKSRANGSAKKDEKAPFEVKEHDFFWTYTEEPHRTRRLAIIKAHPEVYHSSACYSSVNRLPLDEEKGTEIADM